MLLSSQRVVVLLDEFDELVRERSDGDSESASRFLTTAMLPKLAALSDARRIVYVLATNHIEHFDAAIRRPGRFDLIVPVLPPSLKAKKKQWPEIETKLAIIGTPTDGEYKEVEETIGALTYFECEAFVRSVGTVSDKAGIIDLANRTWNQSIIRGWNPETRKSDENLSNSALGWRERIETIARLPTGLAASV
jgi:SpoVK/Ycf46/Vps4 family AAA+-type ATPase